MTRKRVEQKTLQQLRQVRIDKLAKLREAGVNPYPSKTPEFESTSSAKLKKPDEQVAIVGRVMAMRGHGKIFFMDLFDGEDKMQCFFEEKTLGSGMDILEYLDIGDFLHVSGILFLTQAGEITVRVQDFTLLSKSIRPLPDKWHGIVNEEERYRKRYLDFIFNKEAKEKIKTRAKVLSEIRKFLTENGFIEIESPVLETSASGALAKPFKTHINAYDMDMYLRICNGELWQKKLMVAGFPKTFEMGRAFRNEGVDREHNPDFTEMEYYWSYANYEQNMDLQEKLFLHVIHSTNNNSNILEFRGQKIDFTPPWPRVTYRQLFLDKLKIDIDSMTQEECFTYGRNNGVEDLKQEWGKGKLLDEIYKAKIRPFIINPIFLIDHPTELKPLAKRTKDPNYVESFQPLAAGFELSNNYSELNDPIDQGSRFDEQKEIQKRSDEEIMEADESFVEALEHGMPPTSGAGIGIDRLVALLTNSHTLRETIAFPLMKPEKNINQKNSFEDYFESGKFLSKSDSAKMYDESNKYSNKFIQIDSKIFSKFPRVKLGLIVLHGVDNHGENFELIAKLRESEELMRKYFKNIRPEDHENIIPWRKAYEKFGVKNGKYLSSVENLATRVLKGNEIHHVNKIVDIYNIISLKYLLPAGGEDTEKIVGNIDLTIASSSEKPVVVLGDQEARAPKEGEVIYKDNEGTICRRWNWREVERTAMSEKTKDTFIILEYLPPVSEKIFYQALEETAFLVKKFCGGEIQIALLDEKNPRMGIN